jgi:uncharacterized protein
MAKPAGSRCNLACTYCYYLEKERLLYPDRPGPRMDDATLEIFVRDYLAAQPEGADTFFAWQGGEPTLLGLDFFRRVVALQQIHAAGRRVHNALQTNGTLLDDRWGAFLREHGFLVGISFDGPALLHDAHRVDRAGRPTWRSVRAGLSTLRRHGVAFNTLTVVNRRNANHGPEVYRFLVEAGARHLQFIPLVERRPRPAEVARGLAHAAPAASADELVDPADAASAVSPECAAPGRYGRFLCEVFAHWVRHDVGRVFVQQFESTLSAWMGFGATVCVHQERCGRALALEPDGSVYACDHYVYPEHRLGNLRETPLSALADSPAAARLGDTKASLPAACRTCRYGFACHGDCPKHRFIRTAPGEPGLSYLCPDYRAYFAHTEATFRMLAANLRAGG